MSVLEWNTVRMAADRSALEILDQTLLPGTVKLLHLREPEEIWEAIRALRDVDAAAFHFGELARVVVEEDEAGEHVGIGSCLPFAGDLSSRVVIRKGVGVAAAGVGKKARASERFVRRDDFISRGRPEHRDRRNGQKREEEAEQFGCFFHGLFLSDVEIVVR